MENKKSIWSSIVGGVSSATPVLFACCKGGACVGVCVTPVASLFGVSAATIAASPVTNILEPVFIALSAVSFTVSYYNLYALPKAGCSTDNACGCDPSAGKKTKISFPKVLFWTGLILSLGFISYFEYSKYNAREISSCSPAGCSPSEQAEAACADSTACSQDSDCSEDSESPCCTPEDSLSVSVK